jgi:hypothetical protein
LQQLLCLQELTEEGLPFVILFHHPDDTDTPEMLRKQVALELLDEKSNILSFQVEDFDISENVLLQI